MPAIKLLKSMSFVAAAAVFMPITVFAQAPNLTEEGGMVDIYTVELADETPMPRFKVDAAWPSLPEDVILGQVSGLSVDSADNVWILQRPNSLGGTDIGLDQDPPIAVCCRAAPHVMKFTQGGDFLTAWGGPEIAPEVDGTTQWPSNVHGLFVDENDTVWLGGNGDGDHVVLNYTADGEFIRAYGERGVTEGNNSETALGNPADIAHDVETGEAIIADGYINKRIIGFDTGSDEFSRYWGANAVAPDAPTREGDFDVSQATSNTDGGADPDAEQFGDIIHCVVKADDGRIYVCDRRNNRVQVFETDAEGNTVFVQNIVVAPETGGTRTATDIAFSPDGTYVYIADMMNGRIWIYEREGYELIGAIGRNGRYPGEFIWLHSIDVDSDGNIYTSEVNTGRRVQKLVFTGIE